MKDKLTKLGIADENGETGHIGDLDITVLNFNCNSGKLFLLVGSEVQSKSRDSRLFH
jgi:hypothetical protein